MSWWSPAEIASYSFAALGALVCAAVIVRAIFVPSDARRGACCGGCGHGIVEPIPARCPECGGALTKVGISTPAMTLRLRGGLGWALLAWTVLCGMVGQHVWSYMQQAAWATASMAPMPTKQQHTETKDFHPKAFAPNVGGRTADVSALGFRIDYSTSYVEDGGEVESGSATLKLRQAGAAAATTLKLDLEKKEFELLDAEDKPMQRGGEEGLTAELIKRWFEEAKIDTKGAGVDLAMKDSLQLAEAALRDPTGVQYLFSFSGLSELGGLMPGGGSSSSAYVGGGPGAGGFVRTPIWTAWNIGLVGVLAGIYASGLGFIVWKRRRVVGR